jgi:hypothetical protein
MAAPVGGIQALLAVGSKTSMAGTLPGHDDVPATTCGVERSPNAASRV